MLTRPSQSRVSTYVAFAQSSCHSRVGGSRLFSGVVGALLLYARLMFYRVMLYVFVTVNAMLAKAHVWPKHTHLFAQRRIVGPAFLEAAAFVVAVTMQSCNLCVSPC